MSKILLAAAFSAIMFLNISLSPVAAATGKGSGVADMGKAPGETASDKASGTAATSKGSGVAAMGKTPGAGTAEKATEVSLNGKWTLDYWEQGRKPVRSPEEMSGITYNTIDAEVPGNAELALLEAGLIPDPAIGSNIYLLRPYEGFQWRYSREFTTPEHGSEDLLFLNFEGIDCYSDIWLNGHLIGSPENMLIAHRFDVTDVLAPSGEKNRIEVYIRSAVMEGRKRIPPTISINFAQVESVFSRKAPHTYGWDIMPRLVSAGLWRDVSLEVKAPVHLVDVHWFTTQVNVQERKATEFLDVTVSLPTAWQDGKVNVEATLSRDGVVKAGVHVPVVSHAGRYIMHLDDAELWWPKGYGEPALYDACVRLIDVNGRELDRDERKIGLRTVRLDMTPVSTAENPGRFCFIVNGEKIFIKGSNWTPMDAFHSRDRKHLERTFAIAKDLGCNMLRCWGGNVYEDQSFFNLCDAAGIMVWQDFAMGCTLYPQDPGFQQAIREEVTAVVRKLRSHPSIALWSGNNENDQNLTIGTLAPFRKDPNDDVISRKVIPSVLFELDPSRSYLPSSPYWSRELCETAYSPTHLPQDHLWGPRGYYKDAFYTSASCLFASETGYHGMPGRESIEKMFPAESVYPWTDRENFRWKEDWLTKAVRIFKEQGYTPERNNLMINQVRMLFGKVPSDLDDFIFASQSVQAEALKYFIERFRGAKFAPRTGIIWWNIRDGWPVISDAVVDYYFNEKLACQFIRNVQTDICLLINDAENGVYPLIAVNDTRKPSSGTVTVQDAENGRTIYEGRYSVEANGRSVVAGIPQGKGQGLWLITYTGEDGIRRHNHYLFGDAPFDMDKYRKLLKKTRIYNLK